MIEWFRAWSKSIVIAVIIATLIEMILPENSSKKYIKIVVGIFIVYTIISPVIGWLSNGNIDNIGNLERYAEVSSSSVVSNESFSMKTDSSIRTIYSKNLQNDLKIKLKERGYVAEHINIEIAKDESYNIEKVEVTISEKTNKKINEKQARTIVDNIKTIVVKLDNKKEDNSVIDENDKQSIKQFIKENYGVQETGICVN